MRILVATVLAAGSAYCQQDQANPPAASGKDRPIIVEVQPRACATGLFIVPQNSSSRGDMPIARPSANSLRGEVVQVPAPACGEAASARQPGKTIPVMPRKEAPVAPTPNPAPSPAPKQ